MSSEGSKVSLMCNATNDDDALDDVKIAWLHKFKTKEITTGQNILIYNKTDSYASKSEIHSVLLLILIQLITQMMKNYAELSIILNPKLKQTSV